MISSRLMEDGKKFKLEQLLFEYQNYKHYTSSHLLSFISIISKKVIEEVGGFDKNFIAANFGIDLDLRIYSIGGKVLMSDVLINEKKISKGYGAILNLNTLFMTQNCYTLCGTKMKISFYLEIKM